MVPMFLKESGALTAPDPGVGSPETYSRGAWQTIGAVTALLDEFRKRSVWRMRPSRVRVLPRLLAIACTIASVGETRALHAQPQAAPTSKLIGTITDTSGVPLSRAEVWLIAASMLRTISNDSGRFELPGLPPGSITLGVRRLGYESATFSATLKAGKTHRATFPLTPSVQSLAEVKVQDTASTWLSLFEQRRSMHRGSFMTRSDFERDNLRIATDILRRVPGVQIVPTRTGTMVQMTRGAGARRCIPQLYVHETPYSGNFDDFTPDDIEALEVYVGISEIPPDLVTMGRPICAAIVIWTREPPPKKRGA
ncbi:MAG: carboxypeptidase regulatory-like domain-containing protein [Gemmatimonadaceae bacterium]